jgi:shikimate dehydrogenase
MWWKVLKVNKPKQFAVLGDPIEHSLSPTIHEHFAAQFDCEITYVKKRLKKATFDSFVKDFFANGGTGLNVTVPFKLQAFDRADWHDESARQAAAANTLAMTEEGVGAWNTDGAGLINDLTMRYGFDLAQKNVLIIGAGGAAAGITDPILDRQPKALTIVNRTRAKAEKLSQRAVRRRPKCEIRPLGWSELNDRLGTFDLIINSTSLGLDDGQVMLSPDLVNGAFCYDLSYGASARFAQWARSAGAAAVADGLGMLVEQAALSFAIWLGHRPETDGIYQLLAERT